MATRNNKTYTPYKGKEPGDADAGKTTVPRKKQGREETSYEELQPYFPDPELVRAVNIALLLDRPLLVMGEPGCGKSLLAKDIALNWYGARMYTDNKYFEWNIKSTSKAREGLYEMNHLKRLRDANLGNKSIDDMSQYIEYGALANAMKNSANGSKAVLLIDEIDKADIDFSNDLLNEVERSTFTITETQTQEFYSEKPFIVITSNSEKDLSDAFLRRCVFHYIDLFSTARLETPIPAEWLRNIITARYPGTKDSENEMVNRAIEMFIDLRKKMNNDPLTYRKTVSTSEFLDWFSLLKICITDKKLAASSSLDKDFDLIAWIKKTDTRVPFGNALFKTTKSLLDLQASAI